MSKGLKLGEMRTRQIRKIRALSYLNILMKFKDKKEKNKKISYVNTGLCKSNTGYM